MLPTDDRQRNGCWAQVEHIAQPEQIEQLRQGVMLKDGMTRSAKVRATEAPTLWEHNPPVRFRKTVPTSWLEISIRERRNRQVRRMTAAAGLPTLRLVRVSIGDYELGDLGVGMSWFCDGREKPKDTKASKLARNNNL